ncbi:MAG: RNA pseudouridine synthase [Vicinamibacterales bacterium]
MTSDLESHGLVVVHASDTELVVVKPAGLPTESSRNPAADSLIGRVRRAGRAEAMLVHRLDAPTRGLVLVALGREATQYYNAEIAARRWDKWYIARVPWIEDSERRRALVGPHRAHLKDAGRRAVIVRAGGKPSLLEVVALAPAPAAPGEAHVLVKLITGRFHQIRVMLAGLGMPLVGDDLYGGGPGAFYLEHCLLGVRVFGGGNRRLFHLAADPGRELLADALTDGLRTLVRGPA